MNWVHSWWEASPPAFLVFVGSLVILWAIWFAGVTPLSPLVAVVTGLSWVELNTQKRGFLDTPIGYVLMIGILWVASAMFLGGVTRSLVQ